jgi:hypothetical protein
MATGRLQEIIIGSKEHTKEIQKLEKQKLIRKIGPRLYTTVLEEVPKKIVGRNWYRVVSECRIYKG